MLRLIGQVGYWSLAIGVLLAEDMAMRLAVKAALRVGAMPRPKYECKPPTFGMRSGG